MSARQLATLIKVILSPTLPQLLKPETLKWFESLTKGHANNNLCFQRGKMRGVFLLFVAGLIPAVGSATGVGVSGGIFLRGAPRAWTLGLEGRIAIWGGAGGQHHVVELSCGGCRRLRGGGEQNDPEDDETDAEGGELNALLAEVRWVFFPSPPLPGPPPPATTCLILNPLSTGASRKSTSGRCRSTRWTRS